jgi:hypothetical protein
VYAGQVREEEYITFHVRVGVGETLIQGYIPSYQKIGILSETPTETSNLTSKDCYVSNTSNI